MKWALILFSLHTPHGFSNWDRLVLNEFDDFQLCNVQAVSFNAAQPNAAPNEPYMACEPADD